MGSRQPGTHEDIGREVEIRPPTERSFAIVWTAVLIVIACWPLRAGLPPRWWLLAIALLLTAAGLLCPSLLAWPNRLWFQLGMLIGRIVTPLVAAVLFFGVFTPIGLLMRLFGKDPLRLRLDPNAESYWSVRTPPGPRAETMTKQF